MFFFIFYFLIVISQCGELCSAESSFLKEQHFKVVVPSYNNEEWCKKNLYSILEQNYSNYEIIYVNDCSTDKTKEIVESIVNTHPLGYKIKIIDNVFRGGALRNVYMPINFLCEDDDLVIIVDGDDWLVGNDVLSYYNDLFTNNDYWFVYGNYRKSTDPEDLVVAPKSSIYDKDKVESSKRQPAWIRAPRVFYAWLFKQIKMKDLLFEGEFLPSAGDAAFSLPLIEMSGYRSFFSDKVVYIYNQENPISNFNIVPKIESDFNKMILGKVKYQTLKRKPSNTDVNAVSYFVFLDDKLNDLEILLNSIDVLLDVKDFTMFFYKNQTEKLTEIMNLLELNKNIKFKKCKKKHSNELMKFLKKRKKNLSKYLFFSTVEGFINFHEQAYSYCNLIQKTSVNMVACANSVSKKSQPVFELKNCSHIYNNYFSFQLGLQPQLPIPSQFEALVCSVSEINNVALKLSLLFDDEIQLFTANKKRIHAKTGIIVLQGFN